MSPDPVEAAESAVASLLATRHTPAEIRDIVGELATPGLIARVGARLRQSGYCGDRQGVCRFCGRAKPQSFDRIGKKPWPEASLCGDCAAGAP